MRSSSCGRASCVVVRRGDSQRSGARDSSGIARAGSCALYRRYRRTRRRRTPCARGCRACPFRPQASAPSNCSASACRSVPCRDPAARHDAHARIRDRGALRVEVRPGRRPSPRRSRRRLQSLAIGRGQAVAVPARSSPSTVSGSDRVCRSSPSASWNSPPESAHWREASVPLFRAATMQRALGMSFASTRWWRSRRPRLR